MTIYNYDNTLEYFGAGANLDLIYYPSKKLGISANIANIGYSHSSNNGTKSTAQESENAFGMGLTSGLSLTLFYILGAK